MSLASLTSLLLRALHSSKGHLARRQGLEGSGLYLLAKLHESGDLRSSELAQAACVDISLVSRQVQQFIALGLIERIADPQDGRASRLHLTSKGRQMFLRNREIQEQFFESVLSDWSEQDRAELEILLNRFTEDLNRQIQQLSKETGGSLSA